MCIIRKCMIYIHRRLAAPRTGRVAVLSLLPLPARPEAASRARTPHVKRSRRLGAAARGLFDLCCYCVSPYSHTLAGCSKHRSVAASRRRRCTCARAPLTEWPSARDVGSPCWSACVWRVCSVRQNCVLKVVNSALTLRTIRPQKAASLTCLLCLEAAATLVPIPNTLSRPGKL